MNVKSSVPIENNFANPFFGRADKLVELTPDFRAIIIEIKKMQARGAGFGEIKAAMAGARSDLRQRLRGQFEAVRDVPNTAPVIPPPPPPTEIYGRFGSGTEIIDVGSGNGMKMRRYTGSLKITSVDPESTVPDGLVFKNLKMDVADLLPNLSGDAMLTSFMSMCQLPPAVQQDVLKFDGIHLVPDHNLLLDIGVAKSVGNFIEVSAPTREFSDHPVVADGHPIAPGYQIVTSFAERDINVTLDDVVSTVDYVPGIDATPTAYDEINTADVTMKMDGIAQELELNDGVAYLVNRAGKQRIGVADFKQHACFHLEQLEHCYTLIRIVMYRGLAPPHCGRTLRDFVTAVKILINGKPVCSPPPWTPERRAGDKALVDYIGRDGSVVTFEEKTDGLISRLNGSDMYCKYQWTVDLRPPDFDALEKKLLDMGMTMEANPEPGLWEYGINRVDHVVKFDVLRLRADKTRGTAIDTVVYLLSRTTLHEAAAMSAL